MLITWREGHQLLLLLRALKGIPCAAVTATTFIKEMVNLHGIPSNIISEQGVSFGKLNIACPQHTIHRQTFKLKEQVKY